MCLFPVGRIYQSLILTTTHKYTVITHKTIFWQTREKTYLSRPIYVTRNSSKCTEMEKRGEHYERRWCKCKKVSSGVEIIVSWD